jgi:hypothetical protein
LPGGEIVGIAIHVIMRRCLTRAALPATVNANASSLYLAVT